LASSQDCPPSLVSLVFPAFDGWPCELQGEVCLVSVPDSAPAPADLGPLVKVELVPSE
jgi:hypothetical protein